MKMNEINQHKKAMNARMELEKHNEEKKSIK